MRNLTIPLLWLLVMSVTCPVLAADAQQWTGHIRGSWLSNGEHRPGDVILAAAGGVCEIVVAPSEHSAVHQAASFLAEDIARICGRKPPVLGKPSGGGRVAIHLATI